MKKKLMIVLIILAIIVGAIFVWRVVYALQKSNDDLPALTTVSEMDEADVNSLLIGYKINQLRDVWGEPNYSKDNEDVWQIGNITLTVNYKNDGKVAICGIKEDVNTTYKVEVVDNSHPLINTLESTYEVGEQVTIKLGTVTEGYYEVYVNGVELDIDRDVSDMTYTYYKFTMPSEDVLIEIERVSVDIPGATTHLVEIRDITKEEQIACDSALEKFWEDETNEYYFECIKSQYIIAMDSTGMTVDIVTALNEGLVTISDLDYYGIEYHTKPKNEQNNEFEIVKPHFSIPDFSYAEDSATYVESDPNVKTSGFVNTTETDVDFYNVTEIAKHECTIESTSSTTYLDTAACIWKVVFYTEGMAGCDQTVYLDYDGKTVLIVYGE